MKKLLIVTLVLFVAVSVVMAQEAKFSVAKTDTIRSVLAKLEGQRVTIKLGSGEELSGTVRTVGDSVAHLESLTGKDYHDAVVDLAHVEAVVVKVR